tara:strand:- start:583 stop:750 length:168 start_codon:yes stop_codon:yes gene_type:complete
VEKMSRQMITMQATIDTVLKKLNMISLFVKTCLEAIIKWLVTAMQPTSIEVKGLF